MNPHNDLVYRFSDKVRAMPGGENLDACYACGTCVSTCMIQQKVDAEYNPRRLLKMIMLNLENEAFQNPTTWMCSQCDLCYPACPQQIHISKLIQAVKQLAVEAGYTSPLDVVNVDEGLCSGCGICVMACPYGAPTLFEKGINGSTDRFSTVDGTRCMGCGICVAACPTGAIARNGVSNQEITSQIKSITPDTAPSLAVFVCDWCLRAESDLSILESYTDPVHVIHIPCSGRIDPQMALLALGRGYDGVLVCGCKPGECHYMHGTTIGSCKMAVLGRMYNQMDIAGPPVRFVQIGTQERGRIRAEVDDMLNSMLLRKES